MAEKLRKNTDTQNILIKLGEEGVLVHAGQEKTNELFLTDRIFGLNKSPKDVAGAGDSMLITAAMTLSVGGSIWDAALIGSAAASVQVGRLGNSPLKLQELRTAIRV